MSHDQALRYWDDGKRNAHEFSLSLLAENVQITLPQNLYSQPSPQHAPTLRCYEVQLEARSVLQYLDFFLSTSPVTITIPVANPVSAAVASTAPVTVATGPPGSMSGAGSGASAAAGADNADAWNDKETYINVTEFSFEMHNSRGDIPMQTVYRGTKKLHFGEVKIQLLPAQLLLALTCFNNFNTQVCSAALILIRQHTIHTCI